MVTGSRASGDRRSVSAETTTPAAGSQNAPCLVAPSSRGWDDTDTEAFHRVHHFGVLALSGRRSQIEFPTVEVDGVDEVLLIAETARRGLDPLNP